MVRESYQKQLENLKNSILEMGDLVADRLKKGLSGFKKRDEELVEELGKSDEEVDDRYLSIEKKCTELLALQQPVAIDLRIITTSLKIATDLERIADLALNLGQYSLEYREFEGVSAANLMEIGDHGLGMVYESVKSFYDQDVERAERVVELDKQMDKLCDGLTKKVIKRLIKSETKPSKAREAEELAAGVAMTLLSIRDLERVGDHSVNIAARTVYMLESRKDYI